MDFHQTVHKTSGRIEIRRCWAVSDPLAFEHIISSLPPDAARLLAAIQHQWAIENRCHWVMDVTFGEDRSRIRNGESAENMAVLRTIALNLLKRDTSKSSLRQKRFRASMDNDFLLHLITQF